MELFIVILLISTGIILLLLEFLVIPGIAVAGIGGVAFIVGGIIYSYKALGDVAGNYTLVLSAIIFLVTLVLVLRSKTWNKAMLKAEIDGTVKEHETEGIEVGETAVTVSRLAPMGKVRIHGKVVEAKSVSGFVNPDSRVTVVKVQSSILIVKLIID